MSFFPKRETFRFIRNQEERIPYPALSSPAILDFLLPLALVCLAFSMLGGEKGASLITLFCVFAIAGQGLNLLMGSAGQVVLCQGGFLGCGTFLTMLLVERLAFPFWLALPAAGLGTAFAGLLFFLPVGRFSTYHLAAATLLGQFLIVEGLALWETSAFTPMLSGPHRQMTLLDFKLSPDTTVMFTALLTFIVIEMLLQNLACTRFGRALKAQREDAGLAAVLGVRSFPLKFLAFSLCAFCAGAAGSLYFMSRSHLSFQDFGLQLSLLLIAVVLVGGLGRPAGPIFGAALLVGLREVVEKTFTHLPAWAETLSRLSPPWEAVCGLVIITFILARPDGLVTLWARFIDELKVWPLSARLPGREEE